MEVSEDCHISNYLTLTQFGLAQIEESLHQPIMR